MPVHLIWGDDLARRDRAIEILIEEIIEPTLLNLHLTRLDGADSTQANQALTEARTPPFGQGGRIVILQRSPFCNGCPKELAQSFEEIIPLIPHGTHLVLVNPNKPDGRLITTKMIQKLVKNKQAFEQNFLLPKIWDEAGQKELVHRTAQDLNLKLDEDSAALLVESIGNDSSRLTSELTKLALLANAENKEISSNINNNEIVISKEIIKSLVKGLKTNSLKIGDFLLEKKLGQAIEHIDALLDEGEPALKIIATLSSQIRGWLWVCLLDTQNTSMNTIAKAAGIANPKRIYIMRKQIRGKTSRHFLTLLSQLLTIESSIKNGVEPREAFIDGLLNEKYLL